MKCRTISVVMGFVMVALFVLSGCGGGGSEAIFIPSGTANSHITSIKWTYYNAAPDLSNEGYTCFMSVEVYYNESIAAADIESIGVKAPNGWRWTIPATANQLGVNSSGKPFVGGNIVGNIDYGETIYKMPLAGTWFFQLKLKNGQISTVERVLNEPGSTAAATHKYVYTKEDWTPSTNASQYIAALGRFPAQGYTLHYTAANGGLLTTKGLSAVRNSFLAAEPHAFNMAIWLFDANKAYLGCTITEFSPQDHSRTNLIDGNGELMIMPASTVSSTGQVDLSAVRYISFVFIDGAQYGPNSNLKADYRSVSSLVAVSDISGSADIIAPEVTPPSETMYKGASRQCAAACAYPGDTALDMALFPGIPGTPYLASP